MIIKDDPETLRRAALTLHEKYGDSQQIAINRIDLANSIDGKDLGLIKYYYPAFANTGSSA